MYDFPTMGVMKRMNRLFILIIALVLWLSPCALAAATAGIFPSPSDKNRLKLMEDSLKRFSIQFLNDSSVSARQKANYSFIPTLKRALLVPGSFGYRFDSLESVSILYPPDSSFRIFTWQAGVLNNRVRYYGIIQARSKQLKAWPLFDHSDTMEFKPQRTMPPQDWYGALYYHLTEHIVQGKKIYTLFGYEIFEPLSRRKLLEVLYFNEKGEPRFGYPLFVYKNDSSTLRPFDTLSRVFIDYYYKAAVTLNHEPELNMILFDHLAPLNDKAKDAYFQYVPDGTVEGFIWKDEAWRHVNKLQTININENDNPPIPSPVFGKPQKQPVLEGEDPMPAEHLPSDSVKKVFAPPPLIPPSHGNTNPFPSRPR